MSELEAIIRDEIHLKGPIPFARFMELALYHPALGYYRRGRDPFGLNGDFYTAEQLPVFGQSLGLYAARLCSALAPEGRFEILALGAGRGELRDSLSRWNYRAFDWVDNTLLPELSGLGIANESFDALPFCADGPAAGMKRE